MSFQHLDVYECRDLFDRRRIYYFVYDAETGSFHLVDHTDRNGWMACSCPDAPRDEVAICEHARAVVRHKNPPSTAPRLPVHPGLVDPR